MSFLDTGKDIPRKQIEMPPLPPEEPIAESDVTAHAASENASEASQAPQETAQAPVQQVQETPKESAQAKNFRELREKAERAERDRADLEKKYRDLEARIIQKEDYNLSPDDLVEGKHLQKFLKDQNELKEQLKRYEQQRQLADAEARLKSRYNDFDQVVNEKNILALKDIDPEEVETIKSIATSNPVQAFSIAYKAIKYHNLNQQAQPAQPDRDVMRAQENAGKPRPLNTLAQQHTDSPISRMNAFASGKVTPELQKQLWKEMNEAREGY